MHSRTSWFRPLLHAVPDGTWLDTAEAAGHAAVAAREVGDRVRQLLTKERARRGVDIGMDAQNVPLSRCSKQTPETSLSAGSSYRNLKA